MSRTAKVVPVLLACVLLAACVPTGQQRATVPSDTVVVVLGAPPSVLVPYSANLAARQIGSLVFQSLVSIDASGSPQPDLALEVPTRANGGVSPDGREVTFALDPDARWHDGQPVTAADVVFTAQLLRDGTLAEDSATTWARLIDVTAPDEHTVRMRFSEPDIPGALMLLPYVLPKHLLFESKDVVSDAYWQRPVGSGPYRVEESVRRRSLLLAAAREDVGVAEIRCVFHEDAASMRKTWDAARRAVWPASTLEPLGSERVATGPSASSRYYVFNCADGHLTADVVVRRAIAATIASGSGDSTATPFGTSVFPPLTAEQIGGRLSAEGWRAGTDGTRQKAGQQLLVAFAYLPESETDGHHMDDVASALRNAGISVQTEARFFYGDYYDPGATLPRGDWDIARIVAPEGAPAGYAWPFDSTDIPSFLNPGGVNVGSVADPTLQALLREMRATDEPGRREELRAAFGERLRELAFIVPDVPIESRTLYRGVSGVMPFRFEADALRGAAEWQLGGAGESGSRS